MEPRKCYRKINDPKERLRIVLASLQPGVNKSELCRQEGIYLQQLVHWTQEALKGAENNLKRQPRKARERDLEKEYLKRENDHLKELLLEHTKEISVLKKTRVHNEIPGQITYALYSGRKIGYYPAWSL
ncbi:MAG: transposase [Candidatus Omnitrophica bacterium]|nr:transposase [Candidatus Omnitrophota bacterium]